LNKGRLGIVEYKIICLLSTGFEDLNLEFGICLSAAGGLEIGPPQADGSGLSGLGF
jgi:hypothetical protein